MLSCKLLLKHISVPAIELFIFFLETMLCYENKLLGFIVLIYYVLYKQKILYC